MHAFLCTKFYVSVCVCTALDLGRMNLSWFRVKADAS